MDQRTINTGADSVMNESMMNTGGNRTMNDNTSMNGKMARNAGSLGQGVLWLGATALALVGAKYAWQRAQQSLRNTNIDSKYIETAERVVDSVVDGALNH